MCYLPFFVSDLYCTVLYVWKGWCWCFKPAVISVIRNVGLFLIPQCPPLLHTELLFMGGDVAKTERPGSWHGWRQQPDRQTRHSHSLLLVHTV